MTNDKYDEGKSVIFFYKLVIFKPPREKPFGFPYDASNNSLDTC